MSILPAAGASFAAETQVAIVGAGACGLVVALMAKEAGAEVLVFERDAAPQGSTAMSSGMIMACETRFQRAKGVADSVALMAGDILRKNHGEADSKQVEAICRESGPAVEWLAERHGVPLDLVEGFLYPGHSVLRMHAPPSRSGAELIGALTRAAEAAGVDIVTRVHVTALYADFRGRIAGLRYRRPDGSEEAAGCRALVLACSGFGGNKAMVRRYIPEMTEALYFGHAGNQGDAIVWGEALGAAAADMSAYQGHGSVAHPHGALVTWALMMEGGFQVNVLGERFSDEHRGYSEQAVEVIAQPGGVAWDIFDARLHALGREFEDYRQAESAGGVVTAPDASSLAAKTGLPRAALAQTIAAVAGMVRGEARDPFGRDFTTKPALAPPYYAIRVTGALFHTQGGLVVDTKARVLRKNGEPLPNLFAGGGAARGISGAHVWGYLSGNGLLSAVTLGRIAGREAAHLARARA
jgi:fumarate reductase flavoprotein subunit